MAAVAAPVSGLVIPEAAETIRRERPPWFVRCPPIYVVAVAIAIGDGGGNLGYCIPFWIAAGLGAGALTLFLIRAPSIAMVLAGLAIASAMTAPVHELMTAASSDSLNIRHIDEGAMLTVEGHLVRE